MNPANDEKLTEKAWLAMGAALLRTAERNGAVLTDEARTQFQSAMTALAQADTEKSVCAALPATDEAVLEAWKAAGLLAENEKAGTPLVLDRDEVRQRLYTSRQFAEEAELARRFVRAAAAPEKAVAMPESLETAFRERDRSFFERSREAEDAAKRQEWAAGVERQYDAVKRALTHRFSVITGGPGTGKTSTVVRILTTLLVTAGRDLRMVLTAPTGKAAGRMLEAVEEECRAVPALYAPVVRALEEKRITAQTIHRLLLTPTESGEKPSEASPLTADVLVVDEASMIDQRLALRLMRVTDPTVTRVVFLGDKYQLAAVGPGSVFADLTATTGPLSGVVTEFTYSFRFGDTSSIGCAARAVNQGDADTALVNLPAVTKFAAKDFKGGEEATGRAYARDRTPPVENRLADWIGAALPDFMAAVEKRRNVHEARDLTERETRRQLDEAMLTAFNESRPLCAQRQGRNSVTTVNAFVAQKVREAARARPDDEFYVGRIIIVRANDRATELFNGDVGVVTYAENGAGCDVFFGDRYVPAALLPAHDTGFALTVHQSQGSQFTSVAVVLSDDPASALTTRELLYTGITRAKKRAVVFASERVIRKAVATPVRRLGGMVKRLSEAMASVGQ